MMHGRGKSDEAIVAVKPANKAERSAAEPPVLTSSVFAFRHFCSGSSALASLNRACRNLVPTFPQRSPPSLLTTAACGGLRSAPIADLEGPSFISQSYASPCGPALLVTQDPSATSAVHCGNGFDAGLSPIKVLFEPIQCWPLSLGADMRRREFISLLGGAATRGRSPRALSRPSSPVVAPLFSSGRLPSLSSGFFDKVWPSKATSKAATW